MKQSILVPCNYADQALNALFFARDLALKLEGDVIVLSVVGEDTEADKSQQASHYREEYRRLTRTGLFAGVNVKLLIKSGRLIRETLNAIDETGAGYLVVGTRGARGWDGVFAGSYSGKLVRVSPVPVFAIKHRIAIEQIRSIVLPWNFESDQAGFLEGVRKIQEVFRSRLCMLHIDTSGGPESEADLLARMKDYAKRNNLEHCAVYVRKCGDEKKGIIDFAIEIGADLIAMSTHRRDLSGLHLLSVAADVVNHSRIPVWTYSRKLPY